MPGKKINAHHRAVSEVGHPIEAGHWRHGRASAHVDEDPIGCQSVLAHADFRWRFEAGVALVNRAVFHLLQPGLHPDPRFFRYRVLPLLYALHVDAHAAIDRHAEIRRPARHVGGIGARHHGLGGYAAGVDAGAAEQFALDDGHFHTRRGQALGEGWPGLSCSDDDGVKLLGHRDTIQNAPPMAIASSSRAIGKSRPPVAFTSRLRNS